MLAPLIVAGGVTVVYVAVLCSQAINIDAEMRVRCAWGIVRARWPALSKPPVTAEADYGRDWLAACMPARRLPHVEDRRFPRGHRFLVLMVNLFVCDSCFDALGLERFERMAKLPHEELVAELANERTVVGKRLVRQMRKPGHFRDTIQRLDGQPLELTMCSPCQRREPRLVAAHTPATDLAGGKAIGAAMSLVSPASRMPATVAPRLAAGMSGHARGLSLFDIDLKKSAQLLADDRARGIGFHIVALIGEILHIQRNSPLSPS
jgi:hypothetical protein